MLDLLIERIKNEPVVIVGLIASAIILLAAQLNIVIDRTSLVEVLTPIVAALVARLKVVPTRKVKPVGTQSSRKLIS